MLHCAILRGKSFYQKITEMQWIRVLLCIAQSKLQCHQIKFKSNQCNKLLFLLLIKDEIVLINFFTLIHIQKKAFYSFTSSSLKIFLWFSAMYKSIIYMAEYWTYYDYDYDYQTYDYLYCSKSEITAEVCFKYVHLLLLFLRIERQYTSSVLLLFFKLRI